MGWAADALTAHEQHLAVRLRLATVRGQCAPTTAAEKFKDQPGRVDRVHRAVLAVVAEHPTDAKAAAASVEAALEWTRRQWPPKQSGALGQAWSRAREAPAWADQGLLALEVYSLWLLEVRQRCRAISATGTVA